MAYNFTPEAVDPENDNFTWSLSNAPSGMTIDTSTGEINWIPDSTVTSSGDITLTVTDNGTPPAGTQIIFNISVSDADNRSITLDGLPDSAAVYLYASSSWQGKRVQTGNGTVPNIAPGNYLLAVKSAGSRPYYTTVKVSAKSDTVITVKLGDNIAFMFGAISIVNARDTAI
ncbi:MAG: cadherin repeat domain-containing protein, partial [Planctomycetes bacterium]|nr:cadherin repeat domain-containing protein [Planctomycetota bacterium]